MRAFFCGHGNHHPPVWCTRRPSTGFTYCTPITRKNEISNATILSHPMLRTCATSTGGAHRFRLPSLELPLQRVQHSTGSVRRMPAVPWRARSLNFYRLSKIHRLFEITPLMYSFKSRKSLTLQSNGASFTPFSRKVLGIKSPLGRSIIDDTITPG